MRVYIPSDGQSLALRRAICVESLLLNLHRRQLICSACFVRMRLRKPNSLSRTSDCAHYALDMLHHACTPTTVYKQGVPKTWELEDDLRTFTDISERIKGNSTIFKIVWCLLNFIESFKRLGDMGNQFQGANLSCLRIYPHKPLKKNCFFNTLFYVLMAYGIPQ